MSTFHELSFTINQIQKNQESLSKENEKKKIKKNITILYLNYILRYNQGNKNLISNLDTYIDINENNQTLPQNFKDKITRKVNTVLNKNNQSNSSMELKKEIGTIMKNDNDIIHNYVSFLLKLEDNLKTFLFSLIDFFIDPNSKIFINGDMQIIYNTSPENKNQKEVSEINSYSGRFSIFFKIDGNDETYEFDEDTTSKPIDHIYSLSFNSNNRWILENSSTNQKLSYQIRDKVYNFQYDPFLRKWGWYCGNQFKEDILKPSDRNKTIEKFFEKIKIPYPKLYLSNNEKKLILFSTIVEMKSRDDIYRSINVYSLYSEILDNIFNQKCNEKFNSITKNILRFIQENYQII